MKKKLLALGMVAALGTTAVVGGTLAYFTDTDNAENVMTLGNLKIVQNEQQRDEKGKLEEFKDNKPLLPMVNNMEAGDATIVAENTTGKELSVFNPKMKNVIDKFVTVKNTSNKLAGGNNDAYVRTIFAFEGTYPEVDQYIGINVADNKGDVNAGDWDFAFVNEKVESNVLTNARMIYYHDTDDSVLKVWTIAEAVYAPMLEAEGETTPSLHQLFLSPDAKDDEVVNRFGEKYEILAISQAVQATGFDDLNQNGTPADEALNAGFGNLWDANAENYVSDATLKTWIEAATTNYNVKN